MLPRRILKYAALTGIIAGLLASFFLVFPARKIHAQTASGPQFLVTWKAINSHIPSFYAGKALPSYGSQVLAEVALVSDGKMDDLSQQTIYWYLNGTLIGGGTGATKVTFVPFGTPPNSLTLKVELPNYNSMDLVHEIQLPFVNPIAVIEAPYPGGSFSSNPVTVVALPYFFALAPSNLLYTWAVNGTTGSNTENPESAQITLPQGTPSGTGITISLAVTNQSGSVIADAQSTLTYNSQL